MTTIRQQAEKALAQNFPDEVDLFNKVSDRAWTAYSNLIDQYKNGASASCGWYATIRHAMLEHGLEPRTAHILSHIRSELGE